MASRFSSYEDMIKRSGEGDQTVADLFLALFRDLDARLAGIEDISTGVADIEASFKKYGTQQIDATIVPIIGAIKAAADLGAILTATSVSAVVIGSGVKTFVINEADRTKFAPAAMLNFVATDEPTKVLWGRRLSYNKETGVLSVDILSTFGTGEVSSWIISPGAMMRLAGQVDATGLGGFDGTNVQALLSQIMAAVGGFSDFSARVSSAISDAAANTLSQAKSELRGGASPEFDTFSEIALALGSKATPNDIAGAITALALKGASKLDVQTSYDDANALRPILTQGAFGLGLGALSGTALAVANADNVLRAGFYAATGAGSSNWPTASFDGVMWAIPIDANNRAQFAIAKTGTAYLRTRNAGAWSSWTLLYRRNDILAAVSQVAGVPTGGVVERGSNANGDYIRVADGTQICWTPTSDITSGAITTASGPVFTSANVTWIFPAAFVSVPQVAGGKSGAPSRWVSVPSVGTTSAVLRVFSTVTIASDIAFGAIAVGRWF